MHKYEKTVAIDARMIQQADMHGIARYVYQLIECFSKESYGLSYLLLINKNSPLKQLKLSKHMKLLEVKSTWISFREQWELPIVLKKHNVDLFHCPSFAAPFFTPTKLIMTIHDLNHIVLKHLYTKIHSMYYKTFVAGCMAKCEYILTVSEFSKSEIIKYMNIPSKKVVVTYNGVSPIYKKQTDEGRLEFIRMLYNLPDEFLFCLSNNKPHKNLEQLLKAFCYSNIDIPLVIVSQVDPRLISIAESFGKKHLVYFCKFIDEEHLPFIYSMAKIFIYPSSYEGFGLPPLEAIACGTPVVVARSSSLPEIVGTAGYYVDPTDYENIAKILDELIYYPKENPTAMTLIKDKFTWEKMAAQTADIYHQCLKKTSCKE